MSEEEIESVEENLEANAQATESTEQDDVSQEAERAEQKKRNDAEYNWAEMRRQREKDREEMEAMKAELNRLKPPAPVEEEDYGVNDDDLLEGRHLKDLKKQIKQLESTIKQKDLASMEDRLQIKFPDYSEIVSKENIELLKQTEPELAQSLSHMPDPYSQAVAAYKLLKRVAKKEEPQSLEKRKAMENSQKPLSVNAVTKNSAIGNAHLFENGLTNDLKTQLWNEMQQAMKG